MIVARDDLRAFGVALDHGIAGVLDQYALGRVAQVDCPGDVGTDEVALNDNFGGLRPPEILTPSRLPEITLPGPIVFWAESTSTPAAKLPLTPLPSEVKPIRLFSTLLPVAAVPEIRTPAPEFEEMELAQVESGPPITLAVELSTKTPSPPFPGSPEPE